MSDEADAYDMLYTLTADRNPAATHANVADVVQRMLAGFRAQGRHGDDLAQLVTKLLGDHREGLVRAEQRLVVRELLDGFQAADNRGESVRGEDARQIAVERVAARHPLLFPRPGAHPGAARSAPPRTPAPDPDRELGGSEVVRALAFALATDARPDAPRAGLERMARGYALDTAPLVRDLRSALRNDPRGTNAAITQLRRDVARVGLRAAQLHLQQRDREKARMQQSQRRTRQKRNGR